jgi:NAD(P)H dehydrogenase (quinone)
LMDAVTDDFQHITGHEPMPMDQFLRQNYQRRLVA